MAISVVWLFNPGAAMSFNRFCCLAFYLILCLLTVKPARATVEQVNPVSGGYTWDIYYNTQHIFPASTAAASCLAWYNSYAPGYWGNYTLTTDILSPTTAICRTLQPGYTGPTRDVARYGTAPVCPDANPPYTFNDATAKCERQTPTCPAAGVVYSSGYYNIGTTPDGVSGKGIPAFLTCVAGCEKQYSGASVSARSLVNGVYNYYSKGSYVATGSTCTAADNVPGVVNTPPADACAPGQSSITMAGVTKCLNSSTGEVVNSNSASAVAAAQSLAALQAASAVAAAASAAIAAGLSASGVEAAKAAAAAGAGASGTGTNPDPVAQFCKDNPDSPMCVQQDFGSVEDSNLTDRTVNVSITPVTVGGAGSCPAPTAITIHGITKYTSWTTYCNFATGIKPVLLSFAWLAAAGILIGGFKT